MGLGHFYHGVHCRAGLGAFRRITEKPVLSADCKRTNGKHFPTVIPAGLVIGQVFSDSEESFVTFCKPEGEITFSFYEIDKGVINIDTEGTEIKEVSINGIVGHAVLKADSIRIFWLYEDSLLMISMNHGSLEEAIFFAESVDHIS